MILILGSSLAQARDVRSIYGVPKSDAVFGPIIVSCAPPKFCFTTPDSLEAGSGGNSINAADLEGAQPNDYLLGTARQLGLPEGQEVEQTLVKYLEEAEQQFDAQPQEPSRAEIAELETTRPEFQHLPDWYRYDVQRYARSEIGKRCSVPNRAIESVSISNMTPALQIALLGRLQIIYRENCLSPIDDPALIDWLDRLVYFVDTNEMDRRSLMKCSGIVIRENLILTARHCLLDSAALEVLTWNINNGDVPAKAASILIQDMPEKRVIVAGIPGQTFSLDFKSVIRDIKMRRFRPVGDAEKDYVYIRVQGLDKKRFKPIQLKEPVTLAPLIIFGLFITQGEALKSITENEDLSFRKKIRTEVRIDRSPLCRVLKVKGTCVVHACQTDHGYSGTPLIMKGTNGYSLIGVHTGAFAQQFPACGFSRAKYIPNYGIRPASGARRTRGGKMRAKQ